MSLSNKFLAEAAAGGLEGPGATVLKLLIQNMRTVSHALDSASTSCKFNSPTFLLCDFGQITNLLCSSVTPSVE